MDATLVSPVRRNGVAYPKAAVEDGVRLEAARVRKDKKYPELLTTRRCKLVVVAMEVGGRWSDEAWTFLSLLAQAKAATGPKTLQQSMQYRLVRRWSQMISVAAQAGFAATLLGESSTQTPPCNSVVPEWGVLLSERE